MARTRKDVPFKVRERRLGISDKHEGCKLCSQSKKRSITTGFSGIFFAHEMAQIEAFSELAREIGYSIRTDELQGYLGEAPGGEVSLTGRYSRRKSDFEGLLDPKRAIYSAPRGLNGNLLWTSAGRYDSASDPRVESARRQGAGSYFDLILSAPVPVSSKRNIFTVVSISKTTEVKGYNYHYHGADGLSYLLYGHCHCSWCEPDERGGRNRLRTVTGALKKSFNSGDYDGLEEISEELVTSSSGGYRDTMAC